MWCGGHDIWHPRFAEKLLSAFKNNDIILSYPQSCEMNMEGVIVKTFNDECTTTHINSSVKRYLHVLWKISFNMGSLWYGIWSTNALRNCDLFKTIFSDDILLAQASLIGKFKKYDEVLFFQRINRKKEGYRQGIIRQVVAANGGITVEKISTFSAVMAFIAKSIQVVFNRKYHLNIFSKYWMIVNIYAVFLIRLCIMPMVNITLRKLRLK